MITKKQTWRLRKIIGPKHIVKISLFFIDKGILNRDGLPYSDVFISQVFNGRLENTKIEKGIFDYVDQLPEERQRERERKEAILKTAENGE